MKEHRHIHHKAAMPDDTLGGMLTACGRFFAHRISGKKSQRTVLELISKNPGINQKELAEILGIRPASVSELLIKLESKGLIERIKDETDHRISCASLTQAGIDMLSIPPASPSDPFEALTQDEQDMLYSLLAKLLSDWKTRYPHNKSNHHKDVE